MKRRIFRYSEIILLSLILINTCGCSNHTRLYSGAPLLRNDVALIVIEKYMYIDWVRNDAKNTKESTYFSEFLELLPGRYTIGVTYNRTEQFVNTRSYYYGGLCEVNLNAKPNHVYSLENISDIFLSKSWRPVIIDIKDMPGKKRKKFFEKEAEEYFNR